MRILVLSDTHGHLDLINKLVEKHSADAVVHCGDFGLESASRLEQTPQRELTLRIRHAPPSHHLPENARKNCFKMPKAEKIALIKDHGLLGEFDPFLEGKKSFRVPVYCVWGNHEDDTLAKKLVDKEIVVPNLHLVTGPEGVLLDGWIRLVGVGGNLIHWLLFDRERPQPVSHPLRPDVHLQPLTSFYPSMRFSEWAKLFEQFNITNPPPVTSTNKNPSHTSSVTAKPKEQLWLATHISAGKEPLLEWLMYLLSPTFVFSGHMGPYLPQHYSMFTVMDDVEWLQRVNQDLGFARSVWEERLWSFNLWYFALELLSQPSVDIPQPHPSTTSSSATSSASTPTTTTTNTNTTSTTEATATTTPTSSSDLIRKQWEKFEHATIERQPNSKTKLTDMYMEDSFIQAVQRTTSSHELATIIVDLFAAQPPPEDSVSPPSSKKKTLLPFPSPGVIPNKDELAWLAAKVDEFLVIPRQIFPKEPQNANDAFLRKPSDIVKKSPQYFNLPDAYMGGYMLVDTIAETQTLTFTTIGTYPQSHIV